MTEWVPKGQTINQTYYLNVLTTLWEQVHKKQPELWKNNLWVLHQDNTPAHNTLFVKRYLATRDALVLEHMPYTPDLASYDFSFFPKTKSGFKGTQFQSMQEVK